MTTGKVVVIVLLTNLAVGVVLTLVSVLAGAAIRTGART